MSNGKVKSFFGGPRSTRSLCSKSDFTLEPSTSGSHIRSRQPSKSTQPPRGFAPRHPRANCENVSKAQSRQAVPVRPHNRDFKGMFDSDSDGEGNPKRPSSQMMRPAANQSSRASWKPPPQLTRTPSNPLMQKQQRDAGSQRAPVQTQWHPSAGKQGTTCKAPQHGEQQRVRTCSSSRQNSAGVRTTSGHQRHSQPVQSRVLQRTTSTVEADNSSMQPRRQAKPGPQSRVLKPNEGARVIPRPKMTPGGQAHAYRQDVRPHPNATNKSIQRQRISTDQSGMNRVSTGQPLQRKAVEQQSHNARHSIGRQSSTGRGMSGGPRVVDKRNGEPGGQRFQQASQPRGLLSKGLFGNIDAKAKAGVRGANQGKRILDRAHGVRHGKYPEDDDDLDGFIADDGSDDVYWRKELREVTGYDGSKFKDVDDADDPFMEVGWRRCQAEEQRTAKRGREEDAREELLNMKRKMKKD